jgi:ABC-type uncharacterized transport system substrate-binding protein
MSYYITRKEDNTIIGVDMKANKGDSKYVAKILEEVDENGYRYFSIIVVDVSGSLEGMNLAEFVSQYGTTRDKENVAKLIKLEIEELLTSLVLVSPPK